MPTTPNAQLTKLAIGIASVAALAGIAGRLAPTAQSAASEEPVADVPQPSAQVAAQQPAPWTATAPRSTQAPPQAAQAPAVPQQPPANQQQSESLAERIKAAFEHEREHEHEHEDEWEEDEDEEWEHGQFYMAPAPTGTGDAATGQAQPGFTAQPGGSVSPAPLFGQPEVRTRSKHS